MALCAHCMSLRQKQRAEESAVGNAADVDMEEGISGVGDVRATDVGATALPPDEAGRIRKGI